MFFNTLSVLWSIQPFTFKSKSIYIYFFISSTRDNVFLNINVTNFLKSRICILIYYWLLVYDFENNEELNF